MPIVRHLMSSMQGDAALEALGVLCASPERQLAQLSVLAVAAASLAALVALALAAVGAVASFRALKDFKRQHHLATHDELRDARRAGAASELDDGLEFRQVRSEFFSEPSGNAGWKVVRPEDVAYVKVPERWDADLAALQQCIGVRFHDVLHLKCALIHHGVLSGIRLPPHVPGHRLSNRSMEFLGDSLLAMAVATYLFQAHAEEREGKMTLLKDMLVNNQTLSRICVQDLHLEHLIIVSPDFEIRQSNNQSAPYLKGRVTIEAGAVESLIAAIYLDQGIGAALNFVNKHVLPHAIRYASLKTMWSPAMELQKLLQAHRMGHPVFEKCIIENPTRSGNERHDVALVVQGKRILIGSGSSYKAARRRAAELGVEFYRELLGEDTTSEEAMGEAIAKERAFELRK